VKRLLSLVAMLLLLTACTTAKRTEQSQEQTPAATAPQPTSQTPAPAPQPAAQTPVAPAPTVPTESPCTWPSEETLKAKGRLLLADGQISFYQMTWGSDCTSGKTVDAWLVRSGVVSGFLTTKRSIEGVKLVSLPGGEHGYLVEGAAEGAASSAYYLMVLRSSEQRLFRFTDEYGEAKDALSSTDYPEVRGDQISTAERVGTGSERHYHLRTWRLDPQGLTATLIKDSN
jgi:hypothetical protein